MDPQACLQRILDALEAQDRDEFAYAMQDLADWLQHGGFAPICVTLGMGRVNTVRGYEPKPRQRIESKVGRGAFAIQTIVPDEPDKGFEFVIYRGEEVEARYPLALPPNPLAGLPADTLRNAEHILGRFRPDQQGTVLAFMALTLLNL